MRSWLKNKKQSYILLRCCIAWLFFLFEGLQISSFNALLPALMQDLHLSGVQISFISSCYFYTVIIMLIPAGLLLEFFSISYLFLGALSISVTASLLFSFASSLSFAIIAKLIAGIGASFALVANLKLNSILLPQSMMARGVAGLIMFGMIGDIMGQLPVSYMINHVGWRVTMQLISLCGFLLLVANFFNLQHLIKPLRQKTSFDSKSIFTNLKKVITTRQSWIAGYFIFCFDMPVMILGTLWGETYIMQVFKFSSIEASIATTMIFLGVIIGSPVLSRYIDHSVNLNLVMKLGAILTFAVMCLLTTLEQTTFFVMLCLLFSLGFFSTIQIAGYTILHRYYPASLHALAFSFTSVLVMGLGACSRVLFSMIMNYQWDGTQIGGVAIYNYEQYRNGFCLFLFSFILSILLIQLIKSPFENSQNVESADSIL